MDLIAQIEHLSEQFGRMAVNTKLPVHEKHEALDGLASNMIRIGDEIAAASWETGDKTGCSEALDIAVGALKASWNVAEQTLDVSKLPAVQVIGRKVAYGRVCKL